VAQPVPAAYQANPSDPPDIAAAKADQRAAVAAVRAGDRAAAGQLFTKADKEMQDARVRLAQPNPERLQELRDYDAKGDAGIVGGDPSNWMNSPDSLASAREQIGEYYENGWVVARDYAVAASWYQKALGTPDADHLRQKAAFRLVMLYENGGPGLPRDHAKAETIAAAVGVPTTESIAKQEREAAARRARIIGAILSADRPAASPPQTDHGPGLLGCGMMMGAAPSIAGMAGCPPW
jgi:TPR repeat protein